MNSKKKPRLLDLFCGAGGASMGYSRAGFDVYGIDNKTQKHYPFPFLQMDAMEAMDRLLRGEGLTFSNGETLYLADFSAFHASPPCQGYMNALNMPNVKERYKDAERLIEPTRERLIATGKPFVIENVKGSPLVNYIKLSGMMFNLKVIRERWFELHLFDVGFLPSPQTFKNARASGYIPYSKGETSQRNSLPQIWTKSRVSLAMGIDWMLLKELNQAFPPVYTEYIGKYLIKAI